MFCQKMAGKNSKFHEKIFKEMRQCHWVNKTTVSKEVYKLLFRCCVSKGDSFAFMKKCYFYSLSLSDDMVNTGVKSQCNHCNRYSI